MLHVSVRTLRLRRYVAQISLRDLPEVFRSSTGLSTLVSRATRRGEIRKLGPRLYTTNLSESAEAVIRRNLWPVVGLLCPETVVSPAGYPAG